MIVNNSSENFEEICKEIIDSSSKAIFKRVHRIENCVKKTIKEKCLSLHIELL